MAKKNTRVLITLIVVLGIFVICLGIATLKQISEKQLGVEKVNSSHRGADALQMVQGYIVSEGDYMGRTVNEIIMDNYQVSEYGHIGWSALEEEDGSVIAGYTVKKDGISIPQLFYIVNDKLYTLNNPAIRLFGEKIKYNGTDSQTLIMDYVNNILDGDDSSKNTSTFIKQETFLFTTIELNDNMMQYLTNKDLLYDKMAEGKILMMAKDTEVEILQVSKLGGWSKVREPIKDITGYVSTEHLVVKQKKTPVDSDCLASDYNSKQSDGKTSKIPISTPTTKNDEISQITGSPYDTIVDFISAQMKKDKRTVSSLLIDNEFKQLHIDTFEDGDALIAGFKVTDTVIDGDKATVTVDEELQGYDGTAIKKTATFKLVNTKKWMIESYEMK